MMTQQPCLLTLHWSSFTELTSCLNHHPPGRSFCAIQITIRQSNWPEASPGQQGGNERVNRGCTPG